MRWPAALLGLAFLGVSLYWLSHDSELARHAYGAGSSLSTAPEGLSLARAYLQEKEGAQVSTLARRLSQADLPEGGVLLRIEPRWFGERRAGVRLEHVRPDGGLADADRAEPLPARASALLQPTEEEWVAGGGRLVIAVASDYGPLEVDPTDAEPLRKVFPALPGVSALEASEARALGGAGLVDAVAVFARSDAPALARRALGKGDVWLLANPEMLSNERLAQGENLKLLVALAGGGRPVIFDERAHGLRAELTPFDLLRRWGLGPAVFLFGVAVIGWAWRRAVTVGPPAALRDLRTESVDLVYAVGELYQRALSPRDQLALHRARLVHEVQHRLGLRGESGDAKARELLMDWHLPAEGPISPSQFNHHLEALNRALRSLRDGHRPR